MRFVIFAVDAILVLTILYLGKIIYDEGYLKGKKGKKKE